MFPPLEKDYTSIHKLKHTMSVQLQSVYHLLSGAFFEQQNRPKNPSQASAPRTLTIPHITASRRWNGPIPIASIASENLAGERAGVAEEARRSATEGTSYPSIERISWSPPAAPVVATWVVIIVAGATRTAAELLFCFLSSLSCLCHCLNSW